ncbi:hypothetical protein H112_06408 [Trichophyton rubrum D6]|uniref:Uncharacterized protein n=2 Tax=Trichophyton TaxID=5550 RepID=A0A022VWK7_TRIRU|nr:hypothetical protein H100_06423 [Trichophyton rubrum MR850]EZF39497.1 hypothetical protein H102_06389 [Trichophyton rubrum CBS 100081]EZF50324.1 hypothetical protein H103_06415 [Trichophyton rubrum CBS 288.86]EZF60955.1 hypothetical protein H104_06401 [Trichophyton rubrum CBS 289.86]EZF71472.1 hypothetical protein H105_06428 [Trichophyton soudanense CBS 452.61]EZF82283.1 hypothetical protein H110_06412 [Trichophyton rubrum MR1448]EZF92720.1 hypothetical protein H113_06460 [Trichophyton rub
MEEDTCKEGRQLYVHKHLTDAHNPPLRSVEQARQQAAIIKNPPESIYQHHRLVQLRYPYFIPSTLFFAVQQATTRTTKSSVRHFALLAQESTPIHSVVRATRGQKIKRF